MIEQQLTKVLATTAIALCALTVASAPSYARPNVGESGFWCSTSTGAPVTLYQNPQGAVEPWIEWTSDYFSGSGYDPATRCQLVSKRLESYRRNRMLRYITVGQMNGQNVICTANQVNGICQNLIYTLRPGQDPIGSLYNLLAWRQGQVGMPSTEESSQIPYIDVSEKLGEKPGAKMGDRAQLPPFSRPSELP
ncbi:MULTISPECIES: COP23 domain-containing protein [unclassified Microcoleus]|uniref:COP23 domain-containing protein n=1 Tax=unclassified Microcoleus TaxID=2642155 RepID=UPI0025EEA778|nr:MULTISPECIES: COP23 domain-containing protein [unclassified Microcoleus]